MSDPARLSQESGNQLIEGVNAAESPTGTLEYASASAETAQDLGSLTATSVADLSTDTSSSSSSGGSGPVRLIGGDETSEAMQMAEAGAGSLAPDSGGSREELFSTSNLPAVTGGGPDSGGLSMSAASVGAALAATGAPLNVPSVSSASPASGSLPTGSEPELGPSTEPYTVQPEPARAAFGAPGPDPDRGDPRARRSPETGGFVPREMVARRRAAEAMTRAIVMAPPLPPSMMSAAQQQMQAPPSGSVPQPGHQPTDPAAAAAAAARQQAGPRAGRKRKGRKHGAHTAGIPLVGPGTGSQPTQPPTGSMPTAPGTGSMPIGYNHQGYPQQGYPQPGYPQGYPQPGYPQGYAPQGYAPPGYQQQTYQQPLGYQQAAPTGSMPLNAMGSVGVPTAPPQPQMPAMRPPRQPSGGSRLAMFAGVVVVIGAIIAGVIFSNRDNADDAAANAGPTTSSAPSASSGAAPVKAVSLDFTASSFAPDGQGGIDEAGGVYKSSWYTKPNIGGLKEGVGLVLDLGAAKQVSSVDFTVNGATVAGLRSADTLSNSDLTAYTSVVKQKEVSGKVSLDASQGGVHQYWMIWVTNMAPKGDGTYIVEISDLKVNGVK
ncbi:hypothetical protein [Kineosporia succinea]|uniref:F5/8 type C domain-containing protein n=1 Tax=Kineosporia succinea TaxID=84632 RepID=A0ABT9P4E8_9ACTN|nr:hypothetical protein [Kineosporia succinea]MDP9827576.1 hypothetical protein [Kineosporia succinea]